MLLFTTGLIILAFTIVMVTSPTKIYNQNRIRLLSILAVLMIILNLLNEIDVSLWPVQVVVN